MNISSNLGQLANALHHQSPISNAVPIQSQTVNLLANTITSHSEPQDLWPDRKWATPPGFANTRVSDSGDVFCMLSQSHALTHSDRKGGLTVRLIRDGVTYWPGVQDVIAKTFVANPDPLTCTYVGHRNGQRKDNRAVNLVWLRKTELTQQLLKKTEMQELTQGKRSQLQAQDVLRIRAMYAVGVSAKVLAVEFNTSSFNVRTIVKRETWWHLPEEMTEMPHGAYDLWNEGASAQQA